MSATHSKPTIVFVQGSFQVPLVYQKLVKGLESSGYSVVCPTLPSCTGSDAPDFPTRTLIDDALNVRRELIRLVEYESKKVVVVMHSYGGLVGSEAVSEDLSYRWRRSQNQSGGVVHLFYYGAFILSKGQSVMSAFGESPNNDLRVSTAPSTSRKYANTGFLLQPNGRFTMLNAGKTIYNDLPEPEAALWESRIILQSYKVQLTKLTREAYRYVPSTYLICDNDQAAPPQFQQNFAELANSKIEHCSSGHSPHLSQPAMLVNKIVKMIETVTAALS